MDQVSTECSGFDPTIIDLAPGFDPRQALEMLRVYGAVLLRGALNRRAVTQFGLDALSAFAELDANSDSLSPEDKAVLERMEMPVPVADRSFRTRVENYAVLGAPALVDLMERVSGPFVWHYPPQIRRQTPGKTKGFLPFHQDAPYNKHYAGFLVCWTPLTPCGYDAPGLELALGRVDTLMEHRASGAWEAELAPEVQETLLKTFPIYHPVMEPGDVILFDHLCFHRTYVPPNVSKVRVSIDFRAPAIDQILAPARQSRKFIDPRTLNYAKL